MYCQKSSYTDPNLLNLRVKRRCDAGPPGLLSLDHLGFGWDVLAMSRDWLLLLLISHFHFGSGGTIFGLLLTISNFGAIYIQSTLRRTWQWIRFGPRKAPLSQTSSSCLSGNRCLLISELRAIGRQGGRAQSLFCPLLDGGVTVPCRGLGTRSGARAGPWLSERLCQREMQCIKESG